MAETTTGRRDRKKQQTRQAIGAAAMRLFLARGFDAVTVADVAREADVAVQTVFNHFPTKEDLFLQERADFVALPSTAVRDRRPGESVAQALADGYLRLLDGYQAVGLLPQSVEYLRALDASPALRGRELELRREREELLAATLAEREPTPGDPLRPRLVAALASAVDRVLDQEARRLLVAGEPADSIRAAMTPLARRLFGALDAAAAHWDSGA
ncbi:TetR/AcrR family transcriptional regulator [Solihabitans fulvus]|uniref:TetR/AcrR family transcriptional regulator n=1 Tax=Solihabitans fulvus TaxID=1892852 RepID=A0A5B2XMK2_9PSEU|nr:TetR/AcrR family transcriptional regulator [Solihabitans fulvus]KAA2264032.1 TetR/AcrR family transcriptional regulator [Solihabitans fulvus]